MEDSNYNKIMQLLAFDDPSNFYLGIELLKSTRDPELIAKIISGQSYISYRPGFPLIPFFQENPEIWAAVLAKIPDFKAQDILKYMPHSILFLQNNTLAGFCDLVDMETAKIFKDFPSLIHETLKRDKSAYFYTTVGDSIIDGIGWTVFTESRDVGPAEAIHEEEWRATAHHPDFLLKFEYQESGGTIPKMWMEKIK